MATLTLQKRIQNQTQRIEQAYDLLNWLEKEGQYPSSVKMAKKSIRSKVAYFKKLVRMRDSQQIN